MTLDNLLRTGQLKRHDTDAVEVTRLIASARRNVADAHATAISPENRFDAAYKAIMQAGLVALLASGYRPDTHRPGHHATTLQSLAKSMGLSGDRIQVLDTLRRKRNLSDYTGTDIDEGSVNACIAEAEKLLDELVAWLARVRPDLHAKG